MEPVKIRNFYSARILEKIKKIKNLISNISYHSPVYGKLNLEEIPKKLEITPPNLWLGEKEKGLGFTTLSTFSRFFQPTARNKPPPRLTCLMGIKEFNHKTM